MTSDYSLRWALLSNAAFSGLSALTLFVSTDAVSQLIGIESVIVLRLIGAALLLFALDLLHQATRRRLATWRALYASFADFTWVVGSLLLVIFAPGLLSSSGVLILLVIAAAVLAFGSWQIHSVGRLHRTDRAGEYQHCVLVASEISPAKLWPVMSDLGSIHLFARNLRSAVLLEGRSAGVGAVRTCEDSGGRRWSEKCVAFESGNSYEMQFLCDAPGFPFPVSQMRGGWRLLPGAQVMVWWELRPKNRWMAPVLLAVFGYQADRDFPRVVQRMAAHALGEPEPATERNAMRRLGMLLPAPC